VRKTRGLIGRFATNGEEITFWSKRPLGSSIRYTVVTRLHPGEMNHEPLALKGVVKAHSG
jgi:hypothetical protein